MAKRQSAKSGKARPTNQPPRGMRDFLPVDAIFRDEVVSKISAVYRSYGFDPIGTPAVEYTNVLERKSGEEASGQIYRIEGDMGLRFDFTVGLARAVSNTSIPKPLKVYRFGPVWRRDEPQKGRYREFWQADADIIGSNSPKCEVELLACASEALEAVGIKKFKIRLNSVLTLKDIIMKAGILESNAETVTIAVDKMGKIGQKGVEKILKDKKINSKSITALMKMINSQEKDFYDTDRLRLIIDLAKKRGVKNIEVDYSLSRGLAYYSSSIFEFENTEGESLGSIAAGGRYDDFLNMYGSPSPAVGISIGIDRILEILKAKKTKKTTVQVYIATINDTVYEYAAGVSDTLRKLGISVSSNLTERSLRKQLDYVNSLGIGYCIIIGEDEKKLKKVTLKNMESGKEEKLSLKSAAAQIAESL